MALFGDYTTQALANVQALSRARAKVIDEGMARQAKLRDDPTVTRPISGGSGQILNILV